MELALSRVFGPVQDYLGIVRRSWLQRQGYLIDSTFQTCTPEQPCLAPVRSAKIILETIWEIHGSRNPFDLLVFSSLGAVGIPGQYPGDVR